MERIISGIHQRLRRFLATYPILQAISRVGWKVILLEVLIEIPFLILESSVLMRFLFGFTLGLTVWQHFGLVISLYLGIEACRYLFLKYVQKRVDAYRFFGTERDILGFMVRHLFRLTRRRSLS